MRNVKRLFVTDKHRLTIRPVLPGSVLIFKTLSRRPARLTIISQYFQFQVKTFF